MPMATLPYMKIAWTAYAGGDPFLYYAVYRRPRLGWEAALEAMTPGLFWRMREKAGLTTQDDSVNNYDGVIAAGVVLDQPSLDTTDSYADRAASFDGAAGHISNASFGANQLDGGGTLVIRFKANTLGEGSNGFLIDKGSWNLSLIDQSGSTCKLRLIHTFSGTDGQWTTTNRVITYGTPYLVFVTYNADAVGNNPTIYLKDLATGTETTLTVGSGITEDTTPTGTRDTDAASSIRVGNRAANDRTFGGIVDEFAFYTYGEISATSIGWMQDSVGAQANEGWIRIAKITDQQFTRYDDYLIDGGREYEYTVTVGATVSGQILESDKQDPPSVSSLSFTGLRLHDIANPASYAEISADTLDVDVQQDIEYIRARGRKQPTAQVGEFEYSRISVSGTIHTHADREQWTALRDLVARQRANGSVLCLRSGNHPERYFCQATPVQRQDKVGVFGLLLDLTEVFYDEMVP